MCIVHTRCSLLINYISDVAFTQARTLKGKIPKSKVAVKENIPRERKKSSNFYFHANKLISQGN